MAENKQPSADKLKALQAAMAKIDKDITVSEFEEAENGLIHMVFDGEKMRFPTDELNLKGMMITYDKRE